MVLNMLDREYWRGLSAVDGATSSDGQVLSDRDISMRLIALAPIAASLNDKDVTDAIRRLSVDDDSPQVRDAAIAALAGESIDKTKNAEDGAGAHAGRQVEESSALRA